MGKRGPPPTPTKLKILDGTHRKDKHGDPDLEPKGEVLDKLPPPPRHLGAEGKKRWKKTGQILLEMGLLTLPDLEALEVYADAWDERAACLRVEKKQGRYFTNAKTKVVVMHPAVRNRRDCEKIIKQFHACFGMTASDRNGMQVNRSANKSKTPSRKRKA